MLKLLGGSVKKRRKPRGLASYGSVSSLPTSSVSSRPITRHHDKRRSHVIDERMKKAKDMKVNIVLRMNDWWLIINFITIRVLTNVSNALNLTWLPWPDQWHISVRKWGLNTWWYRWTVFLFVFLTKLCLYCLRWYLLLVLKSSETLDHYQAFTGNGKHKGRNRSPENADEYGDGEVTIATAHQGLGIASFVEPFKGEKADQVLRNRTTPDQTLSTGTWVWGMSNVSFHIQ